LGTQGFSREPTAVHEGADGDFGDSAFAAVNHSDEDIEGGFSD